MFRSMWTASVHTRYFLSRYMPTNIALDAIRTRRGLKWGVPAVLLTIPYLYAASVLRVLIEGGGPGWLHLVVLVLVWNALKFIITGPLSVVLLIHARGHESRRDRPNPRCPHRPRGPLRQMPTC